MKSKISDTIIEDLYSKAGGNLSAFLFLRDEDKKLIRGLIREKLIKPVDNGNNRPMFTITQKLKDQYKEITKSNNQDDDK